MSVLPTRKTPARELPERITLAVSIVLLVLLLGGLVVLNLRAGDTPAALRVTPDFDGVVQRDGSWYLPVEVENTGDEPTDMVTVALELDGGGTSAPEVSELEFSFVAGGEVESGWVAFDEEPTRDNVTTDPVSYTDP